MHQKTRKDERKSTKAASLVIQALKVVVVIKI